MDPSRPAEAPGVPPDTLEFVRFCYRRRRVGWPELYDEMCAVAGRGLFRGWRFAELETHGIGFSLHQTLELARIAGQVAAEEGDRRGRGVTPGVLAREAVGGPVEAPTAPPTTPERVAASGNRDDECTFEVRIVAAAERGEPETGPAGLGEETTPDPTPSRVAVPMDAPVPGRAGPAQAGTVLVPSLVRSAAVAG